MQDTFLCGSFLFYKFGGEVALKLNARQKAFCEYYVASGNATEAAIKAGYSENYANKNINKLLGKVGIKNYIQERSCGPLFITCKRANGKYERLNSNSLRMIFNKIGKRAGIKNCHPHKMRRTMATKALRSGMKLDEVQKILGHEDIQTTTIYAETDMQDVKRKHEHLF